MERVVCGHACPFRTKKNHTYRRTTMTTFEGNAQRGKEDDGNKKNKKCIEE